MYSDFHIGRPPFSKNWRYRTNTGKSGVYNQTFKEEGEGNGVVIYMFDFKVDSVFCECFKIGSPTTTPYLFLDVTTEYKTQYPNLELAKSAIVLSPIR